MDDWIIPDWPVPPWIHSISTTRKGGFSMPPYHGLNLGDHVGDDPSRVLRNRQYLSTCLKLPAQPLWMKQVHGRDVVHCGSAGPAPEADGVTSNLPGTVCAVMTADCLPVLLCNSTGSRVAAVHAGWRGLVGGVIESAVACFEPGESLLAWLGPAIGPDAFEVGGEVRDRFLRSSAADEAAFRVSRDGHWLADLYSLARNRLATLNVSFVGGGEYCTLSEPERFFSYRRDGETGRMATLIWIDDQT
ncbi:MAG: peptidoglycan editing factor PgeF [Gammaproteobacteria bacterium]|nr:peptidoglycan editing factor PgeF [Gammaproteobacteria bacterium]